MKKKKTLLLVSSPARHFLSFEFSSLFVCRRRSLLHSLFLSLLFAPETPVTMGLTFTKLFARLFSKREMRILMVSG